MLWYDNLPDWANISLMVIDYLLLSFGLYTMARGRKFKNAWISFIPVVQYYTFGKIGDDINFNTKHKRTHYGLILMVVLLIGYMISAGSLAGADLMTMLPVTAVAGVVSVVLRIYCAYLVFMQYMGKYPVVFAILSVLIPCALAICIFVLRKSKPMDITV